MILIYFPNGKIHQTHNGFGVVTTGNSGTLLIDGNDTTTCAADVQWKYIADQKLETGEYGEFLYNAEHYETVQISTTMGERVAALEDMVALIVEGGL